jgi:hypothetical protein
MSGFDAFKGLVLDRWYKVLILVSGSLLLVSFFKETKGITNVQLQLLSAGALLIGLGEWKNHKVASYIKPPNFYTGPGAVISYPVREADLVGVLLDLAGAALVARGAWSLWR